MSLMIFFVLMAVIWFLFAGANFKPPQSTRLPAGEDQYFEVAESLFVNKAERAFFIILSQNLSPDFLIMSKTRLEDIIGVRWDLADPKLRWSLRGRVKSRHVDFLICKRDGTPLMGIELDGTSHQDAAAASGDDLKDRIFGAAGLPFMRVSTGDNFDRAAQDIADSLRG